MSIFALVTYVVKMARLSLESRSRVITFFSMSYTALQIQRQLREERTAVSCQTIYNLLRKFRENNTINNLPERRPRKITAEMKTMIEEAYNGNDELTSTGLKRLLSERWPDLQVSIPTIKPIQKEMGWVCTRPHYCQLLRPVSKACVKFNRIVACLSAHVTSNYCLPSC